MKHCELRMKINKKTKSLGIFLTLIMLFYKKKKKKQERKALKKKLNVPIDGDLTKSKWQAKQVNRDYVCVAYTVQPHHSLFLINTHR